MKLDLIADYLQAQALGVIGQTIFEYEMPASCAEGLLLMDGYYGDPLNHYLPGYINAEIRAVVRSADKVRASDLAKRVSSALTIQAELQIPGLLVKQCLPENEPRVYRRSAGGYWELEVDYQIAYILTPPVYFHE